MPRIDPVEPPYPPDLEERLRRWMPRGTESLEPLALFRTLARHEELMSRMRPLGAGILGRKALVDPHHREVMILRTSALTRAHYEWGVHVAGFAAAVGLTDDQVASTVHGAAGDPCWDQREAAVLALADELHVTSTISDRLLERLRRHFDDRQILELVVTAGWYHTIAYVINAAGLDPEPWAVAVP